MNSEAVVSNSSPLIALEQIEQLDLLKQIFGRVLISPAVAHEIAPTVTLPNWIELRPLKRTLGSPLFPPVFGAGEREAIALAMEVNARFLLLDERPARKFAQERDITVIGTLGVLLTAKRKGLLLTVTPSLEKLSHQGFRIAPDLYDAILMDAGEA